MPQIMRTSEDSGHWHVVLVRENGTGYTSVDNNHQHDVGRDVLQDPVLDPATGEEVEPAQQGPLKAMMANGHEHPVFFAIKPVEPEEEDPLQVVADTVNEWNQVKDLEQDARDIALMAEGYYSGDDQWDADTKKKLRASNRAALVMNEIEPKIDLLGGYQRRNRHDIRYLPVEGSDAMGADMLNIVVKNILNQNGYEQEENEVFDDCMIAGRGSFNFFTDYDSNLEGDVIVEHFPWRGVFFGPHNKKNMKDLELLFLKDSFSKGKAEQMWPDKAEEISDMFPSAGEEPPRSGVTQVAGLQYDTDQPDSEPPDDVEGAGLVNTVKKTITVLERWKKVYKVVSVLVIKRENIFEGMEDWPKDAISKAETLVGGRVVERRVHRMRVTTVAGRVLVDDDMPDLATQDFQIVAVYAKMRRTKDGKINFWGKVKPAMDPQDNTNKLSSQLIDILARVAAYGYYYDDETFPNKKEAKNFEQTHSMPGFTQKVRDSSKVPVKEEGVKFPSELANTIVLSRDQLRIIMNIPPALEGQPGESISGIAMQEKKAQGLVGNEFLYDNLALAKRKLAKMLAAEVQKVYTAKRILRIIRSSAMQAANDQMNPEETKIGDMSAMEVTEEQVQEVLDNNDLTKYDIAVSQSPWSPTMRRATLMEWSQLAQHGYEVPQEFLLDLSDLPHHQRESVKDLVRQSREKQEEMERARMQSEVGKTAISAISKAQG